MEVDPLTQLRRAAQNAVAKSQYRVSVSPHAILEVFRRLDGLEKALGVKQRADPVWHTHSRTTGDDFTHAHSRGDVRHGHHGARYVGIYVEKPRIEI